MTLLPRYYEARIPSCNTLGPAFPSLLGFEDSLVKLTENAEGSEKERQSPNFFYFFFK